MRVPVRFSFLLAAAVSLCVGLAIPAATFAGGGPARPAASPKPDSQKKIWTNDDVERLNPAFVASDARTTTASVASLPIVVVQPLASAPHRLAARAPLAPEQDPRWYAQQLTALETELAVISSREDELRQFRATSAGLPTGLMLNAPVEGITTDNLIAQLEARRQEIAQQIDALGDVAHQNGLPPGVLVEGSAALIASEPSIEEQRAQVARQARDASEQLAQVQGIVAGMQDEASAQNISLQQPTPGDGGNMTTDLLDRLDSRANALQSEISSADDAARAIGVPPGDLR
jgi:hypothetical protein